MDVIKSAVKHSGTSDDPTAGEERPAPVDSRHHSRKDIACKLPVVNFCAGQRKASSGGGH